jgi:hypothetical protein
MSTEDNMIDITVMSTKDNMIDITAIVEVSRQIL